MSANQYSWINMEVVLRNPEDKAEFTLEMESLIRNWVRSRLIESFHIKHHRSLNRLRIRLAGSEQGIQNVRNQLNEKLRDLQQQAKLEEFHEIEQNEENCRVWDNVIIKILEYNTEIIFLLARKYGANLKMELRNRYLRPDFFDMFHLLSNQLGLSSLEDKIEFATILEKWHPETLPYMRQIARQIEEEIENIRQHGQALPFTL